MQGVIVHAPDTSIIVWNQKELQLLAYDFESLKGMTANNPIWKFYDEKKEKMS